MQRWTMIPVPYERSHAEFFVTEAMPLGWQNPSGTKGFAIEALDDGPAAVRRHHRPAPGRPGRRRDRLRPGAVGPWPRAECAGRPPRGGLGLRHACRSTSRSGGPPSATGPRAGSRGRAASGSTARCAGCWRPGANGRTAGSARCCAASRWRRPARGSSRRARSTAARCLLRPWADTRPAADRRGVQRPGHPALAARAARRRTGRQQAAAYLLGPADHAGRGVGDVLVRRRPGRRPMPGRAVHLQARPGRATRPRSATGPHPDARGRGVMTEAAAAGRAARRDPGRGRRARPAPGRAEGRHRQPRLAAGRRARGLPADRRRARGSTRSRTARPTTWSATTCWPRRSRPAERRPPGSGPGRPGRSPSTRARPSQPASWLQLGGQLLGRLGRRAAAGRARR